MSTSWRRPGRGGAVLYAVAAAAVGALVAAFSRLQLRRRRRRASKPTLPAGGLIVISNHTSYADGVLLALACRRMGRSLRLLTTSGVFRVPLLGGLIRRLGFIPVRRGTTEAGDALAPAAEALRAGEAVGIYPEGRLTRDPERWPERAKTGAVRLALTTGVPIVPVAMLGAEDVIGRRRVVTRLLGNLVHRPRVGVRVGEPIDVRGLMNIGPTTEPAQAEVRLAADQVMAALVALLAELRGERAPVTAGTTTMTA